MDAESTPAVPADDPDVKAALAALGIVGAAERLDTSGYSPARRPIGGLSTARRAHVLAKIAGKIARSAGWLTTGA